MSYKEKLLQFNSTEKYKSEYKFLKGLLGSKPKIVLDYGCGLGSNVMKLNAYTEHQVMGYDVNEWDNNFYYINQLGQYDTIYFMHSIAHVQYLEPLLRNLKANHLNKGGKVIVITPNKDWLEQAKNENYKPDTTVVKHFNQSELIELFESCGYSVKLSGQFGELKGNVNERIFLIAQ